MTIFLSKKEAAALLGQGEKRAKFGNEKVVDPEDGVFDSKGEHARWRELKLRQRAGGISDLKRQVAFSLEVEGVLICDYVADYTYQQNGSLVVEDFKGVRTEGYRLKKKLMLACHGIAIKETGGGKKRR